MDHVAKQREGPGGQHLTDFATLPSAVVKVARAQQNRQYAFVVTIEKLLTRGKRVMALTASFRKLKTWCQWCHTNTFENPNVEHAP